MQEGEEISPKSYSQKAAEPGPALRTEGDRVAGGPKPGQGRVTSSGSPGTLTKAAGCFHEERKLGQWTEVSSRQRGAGLERCPGSQYSVCFPFGGRGRRGRQEAGLGGSLALRLFEGQSGHGQNEEGEFSGGRLARDCLLQL